MLHQEIGTPVPVLAALLLMLDGIAHELIVQVVFDRQKLTDRLQRKQLSLIVSGGAV